MILELHAAPEEVMRAVEALREYGHERGVSERDLFPLALALEESASNIVNHAFQRDPQKKFQVSIEHNGAEMIVEIRDCGPQFDPTREIEKKTREEEPLGGWGLHIIRRHTDQIEYRREGAENILRLTKRVGEAPSRESLC